MSDSMNCPVCNSNLRSLPSERSGDRTDYNCPLCGTFGLSGTALAVLPGLLRGDPDRIAAFSHALRKMQMAGDRPFLGSDVCKRIIETTTLPTPAEQADNLIRWLGDNMPGPGERVVLTPGEHNAVIGAKSDEGFLFLVSGLTDEGLLRTDATMGPRARVTLTFSGWERYEELRKGAASGRKAFMAMQYGDQALDRVVNEYFRPAVAATGFGLQRLDDVPKAGLIDDRMRVEIQSARFVIADLTRENRGAYWEAGYAEGLDKPVIYTCEEGHFEEAQTHFDTNHHLTVIWNADNPADAAERLKATIRANIPEAKREDG